MRTIILVVVCGLCFAGCASEPLRSWPEIRGWVLDAETGMPIEGAIVNIYTQGIVSTIGDSHMVCYHVETATTEADGRYAIPAWDEKVAFAAVENKHWTGKVFKSGYIESLRTYREQSLDNGIWYQERFQGTRKEWFDYLVGVYNSTVCGNAGESYGKSIPMLQEILRDAEGLALEPKEKEFVEWLRYAIREFRGG